MQKEILVLLFGVHPITYKWLLKVKLLSDGALDKDKARLVVIGFL